MEYEMGVRFFTFIASGAQSIGGIPILCSAGLKGKEKWINLYQIEKI